MSDAEDLARRNFDPDPQGEFPFDVPVYVFHLMVALSRTRDAQLDRLLRGVGMNLAHHRALTIIVRFGPCTMSELADFSAVDRTTLTRTVDQLVRNGWVDRRGAPDDRRRVQLTITATGHEVAALARDIVARHNTEVLRGVPEDLLRAMVTAERMMIANIADSPEMTHRLLTLTRPDDRAHPPAND